MTTQSDPTRFAIQTRQGYFSKSKDCYVQELSDLDPNTDLLDWDQCHDLMTNQLETIQSDVGHWFRVETVVPWLGHMIDDSRLN